jgi:hypothetical protein
MRSSVTWRQALAWRLERQLLEPLGDESVVAVVGRLTAVKADPPESAELSIRVRQRESEPGEVAVALAAGTIINSFAFRGATHVMTPHSAAAYLALRASSRMWELPSWQDYYQLRPADWPRLLDTTRAALARGPLTYDELGEAITSNSRFAHLASAFKERNFNLVKPLAWQGAMSVGPPLGKRATFQALASNPHWTGILPLDEAGKRAVEGYLRAYGPATEAHLRYWLGNGLGAGGKLIKASIAALGHRVAVINVQGESAHLMADDLDGLARAKKSEAVRLLPGGDQWAMGPGTADAHVVPHHLRAAVSKQANLVVFDGRVCGTWSVVSGQIVVKVADGVPEPALKDEIDRVSALRPGLEAPRHH